MTGDTVRLRRSVLYVPGSNTRALEKSRGVAADSVILDLEDPVAPEVKRQARTNVAETVTAGGFGHREVIVRINALSSEWGHDDLKAVIESEPDTILLPKVDSAADITEMRAALQSLGAQAGTRIWAMIETPFSILNARDIAAAAQDATYRLDCFVLGTNDLAKETRALFTPGRAPILGWLTTAVLAARAYGVDVIDGVFNDFRDDEGLRAECEQGRALGMDGKTLIHPGQIAICNEIFAPSAKDVEWAQKIVEAFQLPENAGKGAISLDGRMVELLHGEIAERTLAIHKAIQARISS